MKFKMRNGKFLMRGGKFACNCCDIIGGCCMYPFPDPLGLIDGPRYPYTDLPAELMFYYNDGIIVTPYPITRESDYVYRGAGPAGTTLVVTAVDDAASGFNYDGNWIVGYYTVDGHNGLEQLNCLLGNDLVDYPTLSDEFSSTYLVTPDPIFDLPDVTITRTGVNSCTWYGEGEVTIDDVTSTFSFRLIYDSPSFTWLLYLAGDGIPGYVGIFNHVPPHDTPTGNYESLFTVS